MNSKKKRRPRRPTKKSSPKPFVPSAEPRVQRDNVELIKGKSVRKTTKGLGSYWHIRYNGTRAGRVLIDYHETDTGEPRPSITVELNQQSRGRGIGTIVFQEACETSQYDEVYASVRKGNIASRKALERAGFKPVEGWQGPELYLVWRRHGH